MQARFALLAGLVAAACVPEDSAPPPVFNAIDPTLQCPAGQVGWDFTTGGGQDQDVLVAPVGSEIKIQSVVYQCLDVGNTASRDLTASFRAECDNAVSCTRPIVQPAEMAANSLGTCQRRTVRATYRCGNETTTYDISRVAWWTVFPSFLPLVAYPANAPTDTLTFVCGDTINLRGQSFRQSNGNQSVVLESRLTSCNGLRRCFSNRTSDMSTSQSSQASNYTKFYYTCGKETAVREALIDNTGSTKNPIDFHCGGAGAAAGLERAPVLYLKSLTFEKRSGPDLAQSVTDGITSRLKSACEGRRTCTVPMPKTDVPGDLRGAFKVEYWCGAAKGFTERKYFYTTDLYGFSTTRGLEALTLQCGGRLRVTDGTSPWVARDCPEGSRVCSLPTAEADTRLNVFCENAENAATTQFLISPLQGSFADRIGYERSIECPLDSDATGMRITGLAYDGARVNDKPSVAALGTCNGKSTCLIAPHAGSARYQYRFTCPNAPEVNSVKVMRDGVAMEYLDCQPNALVDFVTVSGISGRQTRYSTDVNFCGSPSPRCTMQFAPTRGYAEAMFNVNSDVTVRYRCGGGPEQNAQFPNSSFAKTADGGFTLPDGGYIYTGSINCPYDPTPRANPVTRKCIPERCRNNSKRNATMDCEVDSQISVVQNLRSVPQWKTPTNQLTNVVKEGFPYLAYIVVAPDVTGNRAGTMWAYDVFKKKNNTGPEVRAFRCIVGSMGYSFSAGGRAAYGNTDLTQPALLPDDCFKNPPYGDLTSSWYHGSRRANAMNEQAFRNEYNLIRTVLVSAFDSKGRAVDSNKTAPNPIGFFYTPATGYIDQYEYLAQTSDFGLQIPVTFSPSRQIELRALSGALGQSQLLFDRETFKNPPTLDVDFAWNLLGDSPFHPFSDKAVAVSPNVARLGRRNLRATVEIAKQDSSLTNIWTPENAEVVAQYPMGGGNPQEKRERFEVKLSAATVRRVMTVKGSNEPRRPNGWMQNNIEINSTFKLRVCIDFDGISRNISDTNVNDRFDSATVGGIEYKLGVTRRCSDEYPFVVTRDLFVKPVLPINAAENPVENGSTTAQGGDRVRSTDDVAVQQACRQQCSVNSDCGAGGFCEKPPNVLGVCREQSANQKCKSTFRKGMVIGGKSFGLSVMSVRNSADTDAPAMARSAMQLTGSQTNANLMSFNVLDSEEKKAGEVIAGGTRRETTISLGRVWASVQQIVKALDEAQKKNPSPVKKWYRPTVSTPVSRGGDSVPGLAFGIGREGFVTAGPVVLFMEVNFQASLAFDVVLKFVSDTQTIATKTDQAAYGCLGTTQCLKLSTMQKSFVDANEDCNLQGGRLAEPRTAAKLAALKGAAGTNDIWLGAQASHAFDDPTCVDLSNVTEATRVSRLAACKRDSVTQYQWINQNVAFSTNRPDGTGFNQNLYADGGVQGFGTITTIVNNGSPLRSGLLLKANGTLENHATSDRLSATSTVSTGVPVRTARYVCEFDPAGAYNASEFSIGPSIQVSVGLGAAACWPSGAVGACIGAEFKFITAGIGIEYGSKSVKIYDTANIADTPRATIGGKGSTAKWEWSALSGRLYAEIRFFIGSKDFNIVSFSGVAAGGDELWSNVERFRRNR
jgi:hypothetical protein